MRTLAASLAITCIALTACSTAPEDRPLGKAQDKCVAGAQDELSKDSDIDVEDFASLGDEGRSLSISDPGVTGEGDGFDAVRNLHDAVAAQVTVCTLEELEAPDSIASKMGSTTAMMGRQEDDWKGFEVSWSYHPDNGFDAVFEEVDE